MSVSFSGQVVLEYEEDEDPYTAIPEFAADVRKAINVVCG